MLTYLYALPPANAKIVLLPMNNFRALGMWMLWK